MPWTWKGAEPVCESKVDSVNVLADTEYALTRKLYLRLNASDESVFCGQNDECHRRPSCSDVAAEVE